MSQDNPKTSILFFTEEIDFKLSQEEKILNWIHQIISTENAEVALLNYIFGSDEYILEINKEYLNHDYYTDIITFPLSQSPIESDIFISIDRVKDNAASFSKSFKSELLRVIAHGLLHLIGYNDKSEEEQQIMRAKENEYIELF